MNRHRNGLGFELVLGDPCPFRKELPGGKVIMVCIYIGDVTYGVSDPALADASFSGFPRRLFMDKGEGKPVKWLLGIVVAKNG